MTDIGSLNKKRADFHVQEAKRKESLLEQLLKTGNSTIGNTLDFEKLQQFHRKYSDRLYIGPFIRGLLEFTEAQINRENVIFWTIEQDLLTQCEDDYMLDAVSLLRSGLCITCELVPPFKSIDQLNDLNDKSHNIVKYHLSFHSGIMDGQLTNLCKLLQKLVKKLKSTTKASGTLLLNDLSRLREQ
jgi:hypothetical protein